MSQSRARRLLVVATTLATTALLTAAPGAHAGFPGRNGLLAVVAASPQSGGGTTRIDLIRLDGTRVRRIACPAPCGDLWPAWSPDGRRLAFDARVGPGPGGLRLAVVRADGTGRRVLPAPARGVDAVAPAWSPGATRLAFGAVGFEVSGIWTSDRAGRHVRRLSRDGQEPAWSVRGRLAFTAGGPGEIWRMNADGSGRRRLTHATGDLHYPEWSPSGDRIAYTRIAEGRDSIWVMTADGRHQHRLTAGSTPAWSPDGRLIAFERAGRLYVMHADGRDVRRVPYAPRTSTGRSMRLGLPDWQPVPRRPA